MKTLVVLASIAACIFSGCAYRGKERVTITEYRGDVRYYVENESSDTNAISFSLKQEVGPGSESGQGTVVYKLYYSYDSDYEFARFGFALFLLMASPVMVPASMFDHPIKGPLEYLGLTGYWLLFFMAKPMSYDFSLPSTRWWHKRCPATDWKPVTERSIQPVPLTEVELHIDSLQLSETDVTDEEGHVTFDIEKAREAAVVPEGKEFIEVEARLILKNPNSSAKNVVFPVKVPIYPQPEADAGHQTSD